ncbi:GIY-YIG nuclease family protein [Vibrio agarivorans]|uniref:GIY-YIG nuclease family protein n=1 Tax=Vibrio agarivorans TaxID=153622 RepID=UPI002231BC8C|nr:GIY-YIG nuclease family protein [Vibrio agarivorans]
MSNEKYNNIGLNYRNAHTFYIAVSPSYPNLVKVGVTKGVTSRLRNLNSHNLGGVNNWEFKAILKLGVGKAGEFETKVLSHFSNHVHPLIYESKSDRELSVEVLELSLLRVIQGCRSALVSLGYSERETYALLESCVESDLDLRREYHHDLMEYRRTNVPFELKPLAMRIWVEFSVLPTIDVNGQPVG